MGCSLGSAGGFKDHLQMCLPTGKREKRVDRPPPLNRLRARFGPGT